MKQIITIAFSKCGWYEVRVNARTNRTFIVGLHSKRGYRHATKTGSDAEINAWAEKRGTEWISA